MVSLRAAAYLLVALVRCFIALGTALPPTGRRVTLTTGLVTHPAQLVGLLNGRRERPGSTLTWIDTPRPHISATSRPGVSLEDQTQHPSSVRRARLAFNHDETALLSLSG